MKWKFPFFGEWEFPLIAWALTSAIFGDDLSSNATYLLRISSYADGKYPVEIKTHKGEFPMFHLKSYYSANILMQ